MNIIDDILKSFDSGKMDWSKTIATIGKLMLHLIKVAFLAYSATHVIGASISYAGNGTWNKIFQIFGVIVTEATLLAVYLLYMTGNVQGAWQGIAAGFTYGLGFIIAVLGIVADSHINAGMDVPIWLIAYLSWGLPVSPAFMAAGGLAIHLADPKKGMERRQRAIELQQAEENHRHEIARTAAESQQKNVTRELELQKALTGIRIQRSIMQNIAGRVDDIANSPAVVRAIDDGVSNLIPQWLAGVGLQLPDGEIIDGDITPQDALIMAAATTTPEPTIKAKEETAVSSPTETNENEAKGENFIQP